MSLLLLQTIKQKIKTTQQQNEKENKTSKTIN
jgi:hypothetical protein